MVYKAESGNGSASEDIPPEAAGAGQGVEVDNSTVELMRLVVRGMLRASGFEPADGSEDIAPSTLE